MSVARTYRSLKLGVDTDPNEILVLFRKVFKEVYHALISVKLNFELILYSFHLLYIVYNIFFSM